ncbi:MAG: sodium:calcium antiporter [Candidatus Aenigmatarchaeota archaeon]
MVVAFVAIVSFIIGLVILIYSSNKAVEHSLNIATTMRIAPFIVGLIFVSLGTDLPEIANSLIANSQGFGDINVGASLGSVVAQITLIMGLVAILSNGFRIKRKEVIISGFFLVLSLVLSLIAIQTGFIPRSVGFLLVVSWLFFSFLIKKITEKDVKKNFVYKYNPDLDKDIAISILGFIGVAIGAYILVESIIELSSLFSVSDFIISFFLVSVGTSIPELVVNLSSIKKREFEMAIGNTIGSCIIDATVPIGLGSLFFPTTISVDAATLTGLYAIFATIVVIATMAVRKKLDRNIGIFFLIIYLFSFFLLSV